MKKNTATKIMAIIALLGIILGVVSTGALILYETVFAPKTAVENTSPQSEKLDLSKLLQDSSGTTSNGITK